MLAPDVHGYKLTTTRSAENRRTWWTPAESRHRPVFAFPPRLPSPVPEWPGCERPTRVACHGYTVLCSADSRRPAATKPSCATLLRRLPPPPRLPQRKVVHSSSSSSTSASSSRSSFANSWRAACGRRPGEGGGGAVVVSVVCCDDVVTGGDASLFCCERLRRR